MSEYSAKALGLLGAVRIYGDEAIMVAAAQTHALLAVADAVERVVALLAEPVVEAEVHCQGCACASEEQLPTAMELADQIAAAVRR
jgi:hypothetical protein